jgi:hypothetical protein
VLFGFAERCFGAAHEKGKCDKVYAEQTPTARQNLRGNHLEKFLGFMETSRER